MDERRGIPAGSYNHRLASGCVPTHDGGVFFVDARTFARPIEGGPKTKLPTSNVIFELGFMAGAWGRERTVIVHRRSHEPDRFSDLDGVTKKLYRTSITESAESIGDHFLKLGARPRNDSEVASLVRMLNISMPDHPDVSTAPLRTINTKATEKMDHVGEFVEYLEDALSDYVLPVSAGESGLRAYYAAYLRDGARTAKGKTYTHVLPSNADDRPSDDGLGFVIAASNYVPVAQARRSIPRVATSQPFWRMGQPIGDEDRTVGMCSTNNEAEQPAREKGAT